MVAIALCVATTAVGAKPAPHSTPPHASVHKASAWQGKHGAPHPRPDARSSTGESSSGKRDVDPPAGPRQQMRRGTQPTLQIRTPEEPGEHDPGRRVASPNILGGGVRVRETNRASNSTGAEKVQHASQQSSDSGTTPREYTPTGKGQRRPHAPSPHKALARGGGSVADRDECVCDMRAFADPASPAPPHRVSMRSPAPPRPCEPKCDAEVCKSRARRGDQKRALGRAPASAATRLESSGCRVRTAEQSHVE
jgi:hypothetical protein